MRATTVFASLLSVASALPSLAAREPEANRLEARDTTILDYTVETWPTEGVVYNNQSYAFLWVRPENDTHYFFGFYNSNPRNTDSIYTFTVTGEGLGTIVEKLAATTSANHVVEKTNKPFHINILSN